MQTLEALGRAYKFRLDVPFEKLPLEIQHMLFYGSGKQSVRFSYADGVRDYDVNKPFEGIIRNLERRFKETESEWAREEIGRFMSGDALRGLPRHASATRSRSPSRSTCRRSLR